MTEQEKRFCEEYVQSYEVKTAVLKAGLATQPGTTKGQQLLARSDIKLYIARLEGEARERNRTLKDKVIEELAAIGFSKPSNYLTYDKDGKAVPKKFHELTLEEQSAIKEIVVSPDGYVTVKLYDKLKSLEMLGKHFGLLKEQVEINMTQTVLKVNLGFEESEEEAMEFYNTPESLAKQKRDGDKEEDVIEAEYSAVSQQY